MGLKLGDCELLVSSMGCFHFLSTEVQGHGHSQIEVQCIPLVQRRLIDNNSMKDKVDSKCICMSTYLKLMSIHPTGRPTVYDTNLFDVHGLII